MSTGKILNEIKIARQRSNHCKENSPSVAAYGFGEVRVATLALLIFTALSG